MPTVVSPAWASSELDSESAAPQHLHVEVSQAFHIQCGHAEPSSPLKSVPTRSSISDLPGAQATTWKSPSTPSSSTLPHPAHQPMLSALPLMSIENSSTSHPLCGHHPIPAGIIFHLDQLSPHSLSSPRKPPEGTSEHQNQVPSLLYPQPSRAPTSLR